MRLREETQMEPDTGRQDLWAVSHGFLVVWVVLMALVSCVTLGKMLYLSGPLLQQADHSTAIVH